MRYAELAKAVSALSDTIAHHKAKSLHYLHAFNVFSRFCRLQGIPTHPILEFYQDMCVFHSKSLLTAEANLNAFHLVADDELIWQDWPIGVTPGEAADLIKEAANRL